MPDTQEKIIEKTVNFVKNELKNAEGGHDWWHIYRVWKLAEHIAEAENADLFIVRMGALLHDIADSKFYDGNEAIGPKLAREFLFKHNVDSLVIEHIVKIIENISNKLVWRLINKKI